jgi:restriction system protein
LGNQIDFARFYLARGGYIDGSKRGVWTLTQKGLTTYLTATDVRQLSRTVNATYYTGSRPETAGGQTVQPPAEEIATEIEGGSGVALLNKLKTLPPAGFERLCRHLLLELDFEDVVVTGKSGDGGIDGHGTLRVSKLLPTKVYFQCKRFADGVGAGVVRDFRGAVIGRADKGIILTTGYFTAAAKGEAQRDGAVAIELVDGERLVSLFEELEIGLVPRTVYDVDDAFFARFGS